MQQVNINEAKTNLSKLIEKAVHGESFVIAKSGKPMVTVSAYTPPPNPAKRVGFLKGRLEIPKDFDDMGKEVITESFSNWAKPVGLIRNKWCETNRVTAGGEITQSHWKTH